VHESELLFFNALYLPQDYMTFGNTRVSEVIFCFEHGGMNSRAINLYSYTVEPA